MLDSKIDQELLETPVNGTQAGNISVNLKWSIFHIADRYASSYTDLGEVQTGPDLGIPLQGTEQTGGQLQTVTALTLRENIVDPWLW